MVEQETAFRPGQNVRASDGMSAWDPAKIISGPHQQLTTDPGLYLIRFDDGEEYLARPDEMRLP